jgi:hypothetical protein
MMAGGREIVALQVDNAAVLDDNWCWSRVLVIRQGWQMGLIVRFG